MKYTVFKTEVKINISDVAWDVEQSIKCYFAFPTLHKEENSSSLYGVFSHIEHHQKNKKGGGTPKASLASKTVRRET